MRTTWWQRFWRWLVAIEAVVYVVGAYEVESAYRLVHTLNVTQINNVPGAVGTMLGGAMWAVAALAAHAALAVSVPILVLVEVVAWVKRPPNRGGRRRVIGSSVEVERWRPARGRRD